MNPWVALIGYGRQGRSRQARRLAEHFRQRGLSVGGFLHRRLDPSGVHRGHDIEDVRTRECFPLTRIAANPDLCDYKFAPDIFQRSREWTTREPGQVTFVELGRIECRRLGHWPTMLDLMQGPPTLVVACLRPPLLAPIALALPDPQTYLELPATEREVDEFAATIADLRRGPQRNCV